MKRGWGVLVGLLLLHVACAQPPHQSAAPSPCPGVLPEPRSQDPVMLVPTPTGDPEAPSDRAYAIDVPKSTELLVVEIDPQVINASPQTDFVPTFTGPKGQVVTRGGLSSDDFFPGSEILRIASPAQGTCLLRVHLVVRGDYLLRVRGECALSPPPDTACPAVAKPSIGRGNFTDDGTTAWGVKVTHVFRTAGTYAAELTVTDDQGWQGFNYAQVSVTS